MALTRIIVLTQLLTLLGLISLETAQGKVKIEGQLGAAIEWIPVPGMANQYYMIQRTADEKLILTPNESFFPKLGLRLEGTGEVPDVDLKLNGGKSYQTITRWDKGDQVEWGLWFERAGKIEIRVWMSQTNRHDQYTLSIGTQKKKFATGSVGNAPRAVAMLALNINKPGRYSLIINCDQKQKNAKSHLHGIEITGSAVARAAVVRKRWRPAAAHARFFSSHDPQNVRLWIMEMDAKPGRLDFYCPITTPFGYYGPTWQASGIVNSSINFSIWSFGARQKEPPIEKLSHLLAIGNRQAKFSGFSHEGTGVKIRGWEPLKGQQGQKQVFALRVEPGETYDTYIAYFYSNKEKKWHLFGAGRKVKNKRKFNGLTLGSFVEVPGPPASQRTGAYKRQMRYRGWLVDGTGTIHPIDRMSIGDIHKETGLTYTDRGITKEGWFYLETGGWTFRKAPAQKYVELKPAQFHRNIEFINRESLDYLRSIPCEITGKNIRQTPAGIEVSCHIRNLGKNPEVKLFWGTKEALTFAERWENSVVVPKLKEGDNKFVIKETIPNKPLYVRLLLVNDQGQFWSKETGKLSLQ